MPNVFKHFSLFKAERYQLPDVSELMAQEEEEPFVPLAGKTLEEDGDTPVQEPESAPEPEPEQETPVSFAQVQADKILKEARRQAEEILQKARQEAEQESQRLRRAAREDGYQDGYTQGLAQAAQEGAQRREEQAGELEASVQQFLERAGAELDRQMDRSVDELRDLALAVAEKVVCISLKSSGEVISRMIQTAIDKRKRREWVHIYIAECDARLLTQAPASLAAALSAISDRVRIIPMADDESGTCIIEMPDEIVDASAATQMANIRSLLMDTPAGGADTGLFSR